MERHLCSWIGRFATVKMALLPKFIYKFIAFPLRIKAALFGAETDKLILKFKCKWKGPRRVKSFLLEKNSEVGKNHIPNFKTYFKPVK